MTDAAALYHERSVSLDSASYRYRVFIPGADARSRPLPGIVFLHGSGERGTDAVKATQVGLGPLIERTRDSFPAIALFPQCHPEYGAFYGDMATVVVRAVDQAVEELGADPARIYLLGISMGGSSAWHLALKHPRRFAAIVTVACTVTYPLPGYPPRLPIEDYPGFEAAFRAPDRASFIASRLAHVPTWIFHGESDHVCPVEQGRMMRDAFLGAPGDHRYTEYPGVGHDAWDRALLEPDLMPWLLSHRLLQSG